MPRTLSPSRSRRLLAGIATLLAAVSVSVSAGAAHAGEPTTSTTATKGQCYDITADQSAARSFDSPAVPCGQKHTALTIASGSVPDSVDIDDDAAFLRYADKSCIPAYEKTVGKNFQTRLLTLYGLTVFRPTKAEVAEGNRSFSCMVVLGSDAKLYPLPGTSTPFVRTPSSITATEARCINRKATQFTICSKSHAYHAKGSFQLKGSSYPTDKQRYRQEAQQCPRSSGRNWLALAPTKAQFKAGYRWTTCYAKTTH